MNILPDFTEEKKLWSNEYNLVIGVDEVGRGCFAGPVVASAVAFASAVLSSKYQVLRIENFGINDSKLLKPNERVQLAKEIKKHCLVYGIGEVDVTTINKVGIGKATAIAMRKAIARIVYQVASIKYKNTHNTYYKIHDTKPFLLVDAFYLPYVKGIPQVRQKAIKKGDQKSISIAAASIVAKVYRDNLMRRLAKKHPHYQWERNKGYGTKNHQEAIRKNGFTKLHRIMFVETFLASQGEALRG